MSSGARSLAIEALTTEIERATHGYYANTGTWAAALADWMARRHGLRVDPDWVSPTPGVVSRTLAIAWPSSPL